MDKLKLLVCCDSAIISSGFGQVMRRLLPRLHKKYEIIQICQGLPKNSPDLERFPWRCIGTIPQDANEINRMNQDQGYARYTAYGGGVLDEVVKEYKPDIFLTINDFWGSSDIGVQKLFWNKIPCIAWVTADSSPPYGPSLEYMDKLKHFYCWSSFAAEEYQNLGHKNVKYQFPPIDTNAYYPLLNQKSEIRRNFGVQEDLFIIQYVFRNQIRKQSHSIIEGYSLLIKERPELENKIKIHFHTSIEEGWDHKRFCKQHNINYNNILFTWLCQNCKNIEIKCDDGNKNCRHCGEKDKLKTPTIAFGASVEQMNYIYNIADCFALVANSGATELPGVEAMSAGLPLATVDYAYGHDFVKNEFVYNLKFGKSVEQGTQFQKVTPHGESIKDFILSIYNSSPEKLKEIQARSRNWVVNNFDANKVANDWDKILSQFSKSEWSYDFAPELKNPNAVIPDNLNDEQFIKFLYKEILKVDVEINNEGFLYWMQSMRNGMTRNKIHEFFKNIGIEDNKKLQPNNENQITLDKLIDNTGNKKFLLVIKESIGDCVLCLSLLKSIKNTYINHDVYIGTDIANFDVFKGNEYIYKVIPYHPQMDSELWAVGQGGHKGLFDAYSFPAIATQRFLNYLYNQKVS